METLRKLAFLLVPALLGLPLACLGTEGSPLIVSFIDVGEGDSTLIECPSGARILVDGGNRKAGKKVLQFLKERGVTELDLVIATHPDIDHIGGLYRILERVPVRLLLDPGKSHTTYFYADFLKLIKEKNIPYKTGRAGQRYAFGDAVIEILHPSDRLGPNTNVCSIVARLVYGNTSILLTGDATVESEEEILRRGAPLKSQVLKAGHHGSRSSTSIPFVERVRPEASVISCRAEGRFGHPHIEVLNTLRMAGCQIYRTGVEGTVRVETDGENYTIVTEREEREAAREGPRPPVDLNRAELEELKNLDLVGEEKAKGILAYREKVNPFESVEELLSVPGIGPPILKANRERLRVGVSPAL